MKKNYLVIHSHSIDKDGYRVDFMHFIDIKDKDELLQDISSLFYHVTHFCGKEGQKVDSIEFSETRLGAW